MKIRIYEHAPGRWHLDFRNEVGERKRPYAGATKAEAEKNAAAVLARTLSPVGLSKSPGSSTIAVAQPCGVTIKQAFERGLVEREKWIEAEDIRGIHRKYEVVAERFGADSDLTVMTREAVLAWRKDLMQTPGKSEGTVLSNSTINHYLSMATTLQEIGGVAAHGVKHLSVKNSRRRRRVREEELRAVQSWLAANHHIKGASSMSDLIEVALHTTARAGELLNLKWTDVYFDRRVVCFRKVKNKEFREAPLTEAALLILQRRQSYGLKPGPFSDMYSTRPSKLWAMAREALGLADDNEFVFHVATRHEGLSRMADNDASAFQIMAMAGHLSAETTKRYVKPRVEALRAHAEGIASYGRTPTPTHPAPESEQ